MKNAKKKNTEKPTTTTVVKRAAAGKERQIEIRMYNVGFGDSFLVRLPTEEGERRVLVDCGFHSQGKGKFSDAELVQQIKADLSGEPLDIVIATHRHQDHISGFGETDLWVDVAVNEVWLPFTANPEAVRDEPTLAAWNAFMERSRYLWDTSGKLTPSALRALGARNTNEMAAVEFMLWNARSNAPAIHGLLNGFRRADGRPSKRRFLPDRDDKYPSRFKTSVLPGVKIHVLGPPLDPKFRKNLKVPSNWGLDDGAARGAGMDARSPFATEWRVPADRLPPRPPFQQKTLDSIRLFNDDLFYAAKAVDDFLNGESLVLVLEIGRARLLLPGDAEVGSWTMIMNNESALELAASATFLKVGHHGSHNATPINFINEHLPSGTPAMISTQAGPGNYRNGIPLQKLLDTMGSRGIPFVRSDKSRQARGIFKPDPKNRWVDCFVSC
jgi:beta-lactamase superfamily II metal-dependent hydrolase